MTSLIMSFFKKIMGKMAKIFFFSKISLVGARKKIFKTFIQLLKVKIIYKSKIHYYANVSKKSYKKVRC